MSITQELHNRLWQVLQFIQAEYLTRLYKLRPEQKLSVHRLSPGGRLLSRFLFSPVRKNIDYLAIGYRLLQTFPVVGVIQFAMQLGE